MLSNKRPYIVKETIADGWLLLDELLDVKAKSVGVT